MIIPWLKGILSFHKAPIMWTLVILNIFIFVLTNDYNHQPKFHGNQSVASDFFSNSANYEMTAILYNQFLGKKDLPEKNQFFLLSSQAIRDPKFISEAEHYQFIGDQIAIASWKKKFQEFQDSFQDRFTSVFGLTSFRHGMKSWITYQFTHAGLIHLISNMMLLIVFAGALENLVGGAGLLIMYLLSGFAGVYGFLYLSDPTTIPMVGASGSLSGIMAFYAIYEKKRRVSFFYFLSPVEGFYGKIWLPIWLIFPLYFATDLAAYFGSVKEIGSGVAYSAHIGGMLFGLIAGLTVSVVEWAWRYWRGGNQDLDYISNILKK